MRLTSLTTFINIQLFVPFVNIPNNCGARMRYCLASSFDPLRGRANSQMTFTVAQTTPNQLSMGNLTSTKRYKPGSGSSSLSLNLGKATCTRSGYCAMSLYKTNMARLRIAAREWLSIVTISGARSCAKAGVAICAKPAKASGASGGGDVKS